MASFTFFERSDAETQESSEEESAMVSTDDDEDEEESVHSDDEEDHRKSSGDSDSDSDSNSDGADSHGSEENDDSSSDSSEADASSTTRFSIGWHSHRLTTSLDIPRPPGLLVKWKRVIGNIMFCDISVSFNRMRQLGLLEKYEEHFAKEFLGVYREPTWRCTLSAKCMFGPFAVSGFPASTKQGAVRSAREEFILALRREIIRSTNPQP
jgi:hypothetical protein